MEHNTILFPSSLKAEKVMKFAKVSRGRLRLQVGNEGVNNRSIRSNHNNVIKINETGQFVRTDIEIKERDIRLGI